MKEKDRYLVGSRLRDESFGIFEAGNPDMAILEAIEAGKGGDLHGKDPYNFVAVRIREESDYDY